MKRMNLGCADDIKDGWTNVDRFYDPQNPDRPVWDARGGAFGQWVGVYDFVLVNHVLCTMTDHDVREVLEGVKEVLKEGGIVQVIDMNILNVFKAYQEGRIHDIPIGEGSIDDRLCLAISGYGTRKSLYTPLRMSKVLIEAGFRVVNVLPHSKYDTRPNESLIIEATK